MKWWPDGFTEEEAWEILKETHPDGGVVTMLGSPVKTADGIRAEACVLTVPAMTYNEYLNSFTWRNIRADALRGAEHTCQVCNSPDDLEVHHRKYPTRGTEGWPNDLTVLCGLCHSMYEEINKAMERRVRRKMG